MRERLESEDALLKYLLILFMLLPVVGSAADETLEAAYLRMTGIPLTREWAPPVWGKWEKAWASGQRLEVALEILETADFSSANLRNFVSRISNEDGRPFEALEDDQFLWLAAFFDDADVRRLLTESLTASSAERIEDLKLVPSNPSLSGVLTTNGFTRRNLTGGTNRRPVRAAFKLYLCTPIESWKDHSLPDIFVGRDVDRAPGGDATRYQTTCRGCHAPMDGFRGAWAHLDFPERQELQLTKAVQEKLNRNGNVYPSGFVTRDSTWVNYLVGPSQQAYFGWRSASTGTGVKSFGELIANSERFQKCMVKRALQTVCPNTAIEKVETESVDEFKRLTTSFRDKGYRLKNLFGEVAVSGVCK